MKSKSSRPVSIKKSPTTTPASSGTAPADVLDRAREMDSAIQAAAGGDGVKAETIMSDTPALDVKGNPLTRKPGETRGRKTKAQSEAEAAALAAAAAAAPPDPLLIALFSKATELLLQYAQKQQWTMPVSADLIDGKLVFSQEAWHKQVSEAQLRVAQKYGPEMMTKYAAEITLALLVAPWAFDNVMTTIKRNRDAKRAAETDKQSQRSSGDRTVDIFSSRRRDSGDVGVRKDNANEGADGAGTAAAAPS